MIRNCCHFCGGLGLICPCCGAAVERGDKHTHHNHDKAGRSIRVRVAPERCGTCNGTGFPPRKQRVNQMGVSA